ncbi:Spo0E family sporulation regulatory protein-aspartic acid phosphatase [Bacillus sp. 1NLA3E]|uniref:Spo0E family sporulation regulatory protein-aspartic acid phosphatase n=1 Tax=Bacillus sp. 1NLA3E TaxID=666686 RepID=UPI000247F003|nr:Spo0E family sporulation regulatory protein-aspartic acid phosphatase [Bacillus sp. 1NLA3E]
MMLGRETIQTENMSLLVEIRSLKENLRELYLQTGPGNSNYISLSIKLDVLINEYIEGQLVELT